MGKLEHITFPVAMINTEKILEFSRDERDLTSCSKIALKNGFYKNLVIIDSNGIKYISVDAFSSDSKLWNLLKETVHIKIVFADYVEQLDIADIRKLILTAMQNNRDFWEAGGNYSELEAIVSTGKTAKAIIKTLTDRYFKTY